MRVFREVRGAIASRVTIVLIDCVISRARSTARRGPRNIDRIDRAISAGSVMRSRSVPHFVPKRQMDIIDDLREEIRGKRFDDLTTIQKIWAKG